MEKISERFGQDPREWFRRGLLTDRELVEEVGEAEAAKVFAEVADDRTCPDYGPGPEPRSEEELRREFDALEEGDFR
jgi:hypothetical protein